MKKVFEFVYQHTEGIIATICFWVMLVGMWSGFLYMVISAAIPTEELECRLDNVSMIVPVFYAFGANNITEMPWENVTITYEQNVTDNETLVQTNSTNSSVFVGQQTPHYWRVARSWSANGSCPWTASHTYYEPPTTYLEIGSARPCYEDQDEDAEECAITFVEPDHMSTLAVVGIISYIIVLPALVGMVATHMFLQKKDAQQHI